jgi:hypothetical protein
MANYFCHRNDRPTQRNGTMVLGHRGIDHYSIPVSNLRQMEATTICVNIGGRPVKLMAVYLPPLRSLVDADLPECISEGKLVLLAGNLNAKHKDWNSRLNSPRGVLLRELASANSCIVHGPVAPTTIPSCPTIIPDVLNIVVVKDFVLPVNLTVCSHSAKIISLSQLTFGVDHPSRPFQIGHA